MPIYGFDETKSKFPVLDKATYDPANKSGQIAVINDIKPVVLTDDATVNPLIPTLYVMNAASKTITLGTNVNAGIEVTVFAKIATTVSYIVNGVTVTDSLSADDTIGYIFNGVNWTRKNKKYVGGGVINLNPNNNGYIINSSNPVSLSINYDGILRLFSAKTGTGYSCSIYINNVVSELIFFGDGESIVPQTCALGIPVKAGDSVVIITDLPSTSLQFWRIMAYLIKYR